MLAIDVSSESVRWQKATIGRDFEGVVADARHLPFRENLFDFATAISSLEHIRGVGDMQAAAEIGRVLGPGGVAIVTVPGSRSSESVECIEFLGGIPVFMAAALCVSSFQCFHRSRHQLPHPEHSFLAPTCEMRQERCSFSETMNFLYLLERV